MNKLSDRGMELRLTIAERAIAEATRRIGELTEALARLAEIPAPSDKRDLAPVVLGADAITPFSIGFHQREYDPNDRPYRWTGKGQIFELRLPIDRNFEWDFAMELQPNSYVNIFALQAFVDYTEISIHIEAAGDIVRGSIPARIFSNYAVLTFSLPEHFIPNLVDPMNSDNRTLGVVFYELQAKPQRPTAQIRSVDDGRAGFR